MEGDLVIREAAPADAEAILAIGRELVEDGDTYVFAPTTTDDELKAYWLSPTGRTAVAVLDGRPVGCYFLRSNYPGRGRHVADASRAAASAARWPSIPSRRRGGWATRPCSSTSWSAPTTAR